MEIIGRSEAITRGLNTYFTGEPCKHGHVNYRYVQSGACKSCIHGEPSVDIDAHPDVVAAKRVADEARNAYVQTRRRIAEQISRVRAGTIELRRLTRMSERQRELAEREHRRAVKVTFIRHRFRLHESDREVFAASAWGMALSIMPTITLADVDPMLQPNDHAGGTAMFAFLCHPSHVDELQSIANGLIAARGRDVAQRVAESRARLIASGDTPSDEA